MYNVHKASIPNIVRFLIGSPKNLLFWARLKLTWKRICIKVDDPTIVVNALEQYKSQVRHMKTEVKELARRDSECFYFKSTRRKTRKTNED